MSDGAFVESDAALERGEVPTVAHDGSPRLWAKNYLFENEFGQSHWGHVIYATDGSTAGGGSGKVVDEVSEFGAPTVAGRRVSWFEFDSLLARFRPTGR